MALSLVLPAPVQWLFLQVLRLAAAQRKTTARRTQGTTTAQGTAYINALRTRANATTQTAYSLRQICDEWSREFYFEGLRRTTLIRFGYFGGNVNYNWSWKGGVKSRFSSVTFISSIWPDMSSLILLPSIVFVIV